jgi:hypothetical protein
MKQDVFTPAKRRVGRRRRQGVPSSPAPAGLTLVAATYDPDTSVDLTFDRPIDVGAFDGAAVVVEDGEIVGAKYDGQGGATLLNPTTVRISLLEVGPPDGPPVTLSASAANGIVAADDGGAWAGVTGLVLPFPG